MNSTVKYKLLKSHQEIYMYMDILGNKIFLPLP